MIKVINTSRNVKFNLDAVKRELSDLLDRIGDELNEDYSKTTSTWVNKPTFNTTKETSDVYSVEVSTTDEVYAMLNNGTPPHTIKPKNPMLKPLVYRWDGYGSYKAKSTPRLIGSNQGALPSTKVVNPYGVRHPGVEAREWDKTITEKLEKKLSQEVNKAISAGLKKGKFI